MEFSPTRGGKEEELGDTRELELSFQNTSLDPVEVVLRNNDRSNAVNESTYGGPSLFEQSSFLSSDVGLPMNVFDDYITAYYTALIKAWNNDFHPSETELFPWSKMAVYPDDWKYAFSKIFQVKDREGNALPIMTADDGILEYIKNFIISHTKIYEDGAKELRNILTSLTLGTMDSSRTNLNHVKIEMLDKLRTLIFGPEDSTVKTLSLAAVFMLINNQTLTFSIITTKFLINFIPLLGKWFDVDAFVSNQLFENITNKPAATELNMEQFRLVTFTLGRFIDMEAVIYNSGEERKARYYMERELFKETTTQTRIKKRFAPESVSAISDILEIKESTIPGQGAKMEGVFVKHDASLKKGDVIGTYRG